MSTLRTTATEAEARFRKIMTDPNTGAFVITREWPKIHTDSADALILAKKAVSSITDPLVDNQKYTGTFLVTGVTPEADAEGAVTIIEELTQVFDGTTTVKLNLLPYVVIDDRKTVHPFGTDGTDTIATDSQMTHDRTFKWTDIDPAGAATIRALTEANWESATFAPSGWGFVGLVIEEQKSGSLIVAVTYRDATKEVLVDTFNQTVNTDRIVTEKRLYDQATDDPIAATVTPVDAKTHHYTVSRNGDGTFDKAQVIDTSSPHGIAAHNAAIDYDSTVNVTVELNATTAPASLINELGHTKQVSSKKNVDGTYDKTTQDVTHVDNGIAAHHAEYTPKFFATRTVYKNAIDQPVLPAETFGHLSVVKNAAGRWDGTLDLVTYIGERASGVETYIDQLGLTRKEKDLRTGYEWTITFDIKYHSTCALAWTAIDGGLQGSSVHNISLKKWRSIKVLSIA